MGPGTAKAHAMVARAIKTSEAGDEHSGDVHVAAELKMTQKCQTGCCGPFLLLQLVGRPSPATAPLVDWVVLEYLCGGEGALSQIQ